jgi:hypothetical protein
VGRSRSCRWRARRPKPARCRASSEGSSPWSMIWKGLAVGGRGRAGPLVGLSWSGVLELPFLPTWAGGGPPAVDVTFAPLPPRTARRSMRRSRPCASRLRRRPPVFGRRALSRSSCAPAFASWTARAFRSRAWSSPSRQRTYSARRTARPSWPSAATRSTRRRCNLVAEREGFSVRALELRAQNGQVYELGDVRLQPRRRDRRYDHRHPGRARAGRAHRLMQLSGGGTTWRSCGGSRSRRLEDRGQHSDAEGNFRCRASQRAIRSCAPSTQASCGPSRARSRCAPVRRAVASCSCSI